MPPPSALDLFLGAFRARGGKAEVPGFDAAFAAALDRATRFDERLPVEGFASHLGRVLELEATPSALAELQIEDLATALLAATGQARAIERMEREIFREVPSFVRRIDASPSFGEEIQQAVRIRLIMPNEAGRTRLLDYKGKGPLGGWVRVTAIRLALNLKNASRREGEFDEFKDVPVNFSSLDGRIVRAQLAAPAKLAISEALGSLEPELRASLRLYYGQGLSIDQVGELLGVHRATAARWIQKARERMESDIKRRLTEKLGTRPGEIGPLLELLTSRMDISISALSE